MLKSVTSFFLIFIVLAGTMGINYDMHYCGGELVAQQLSILPSDLSCGMSAKMKLMDQEPEGGILGFSQVCCENDHYEFQISDDYKDIQHDVLLFTPLLKFPNLNSNFTFFEQKKEYSVIGYSPPPLYRDVIVLNESFLI